MSSWWANYYDHLLKRIDALKEKHSQRSEMIKELEDAGEEIHLYENYSESYGYVFHLLKRKD